MHYPVQYLWSKTMLPFANIEGRGLKQNLDERC